MSQATAKEPNEHTALLGSIRTIRLDENPSAENSAREKHYSLSSLPPSTFKTLTEELKEQRLAQDAIDRHALEQQERRTLYGSLPFVAAFGMQKRETTMKKVISSASMHTLAKMIQEEEKQNFASGLEMELSADDISITVHLILAVCIAIISQFLVGYNTSVMNAPEAVVFAGHSTLSWSAAVSAFAVGGPFGSLVGGYLANVRGRRGAMLMNSWIFLVGGVGMTIAWDIVILAVARLLIGLASGIAMVVVPVYLGEIAPPTLRGTLGTCTQFAIVIGILVSNLLAFPLANAELWRGLFLVTPLLAAVQLLASPYLVESPRWLLNRNEDSVEARVTIQKLRAFRQQSDIEQEVEHYLFAAAKHKTARSSAHSTGAIWDLLRAHDVRILLVSSIVLQIAQQLSGINAVFYYSTSFFEGVISSPLLGTTLIGVVNLFATILALGLMDNTPRRLLLLLSSIGMIVSMGGITASLMGIFPRWTSLLCLGAFVMTYAVGLGPIPWLIVAEMFDAKYVATAMSLSCLVNWMCNFLVGLSFPFAQLYLQEWCFMPFCLVLMASTLFVYLYLPETQGRSVAEVYKMVTTGSGRGRRRKRGDTLTDVEERIVDMPIIDAIELLESGENAASHQHLASETPDPGTVDLKSSDQQAATAALKGEGSSNNEIKVNPCYQI
eukprot:gene3125-3422_t